MNVGLPGPSKKSYLRTTVTLKNKFQIFGVHFKLNTSIFKAVQRQILLLRWSWHRRGENESGLPGGPAQPVAEHPVQFRQSRQGAHGTFRSLE